MQHGILAARTLKTMAALGSRNGSAVAGYLDATNWTNANVVRAAIGAMVVDDLDSQALADVQRDFMLVVRPRTVLGRAVERGLVRVLPPKVPTIRQTAGTTAHWLAEGDGLPVDTAAFTRDGRLEHMFLGAISVVTRELVDTTGSEAILLHDLAGAVAQAIDEAFLDAQAASAVKPASVLYGAVDVPGGTDVVKDLADLVDALPGRFDRAFFVTTASIAARLAMLLPGAAIDLSPGAERMLGRPLLMSSAVPEETAGGLIALIDGDRVEVTGLTSARLDVATEASILLETAPSHSSIVPTGAELVSLWQTGAVGLLATAEVSWRASEAAASTLIAPVYGG